MRTAHPREQLGNRLICDSLAISYSRDIDDTIAEEDEEEDNSRSSSRANTRNRNRNDQDVGGGRTDQRDDGYDDDDDAMSNGHAALLEQVVIGDRNRRSVSSGSARSGGRGRGQSRSVSPGSRVGGQSQHHDYVNSAPGSRFLEDTMAIPAIPPPPQSAKFQKQQQQQFFSVKPSAAGADSDPYGKEFDAIGSRVPATTTAVHPSSTGSRINGRVLPPADVRKEQQLAIPPRLRNGFVPSSSGSGGV